MPDRDGIYTVTGDEMREEIEALRERACSTPAHPIRADLERAVSLIAERVRAGAPRRATGTELAAMRLALGVLRQYPDNWGAAVTVLDVGGAWQIGAAYESAAYACNDDVDAVGLRVALYLRARLRMEGPGRTVEGAVPAPDGSGWHIADRERLGTWICPGCGEECFGGARYCYRDGDGPRAQPMVPHRRITPLWQLARGTEASGG